MADPAPQSPPPSKTPDYDRLIDVQKRAVDDKITADWQQLQKNAAAHGNPLNADREAAFRSDARENIAQNWETVDKLTEAYKQKQFDALTVEQKGVVSVEAMRRLDVAQNRSTTVTRDHGGRTLLLDTNTPDPTSFANTHPAEFMKNVQLDIASDPAEVKRLVDVQHAKLAAKTHNVVPAHPAPAATPVVPKPGQSAEQLTGELP